MRILIVKTSSLGDIVHNLPAVSDMAAHLPDAHIDWLAEEAFADIPALHPAVRTVHTIRLREWLRAPWRAATWRAVQTLKERLQAEPYDVVLDSQGLLKSAAVARLAGQPVWGADRLSAREPLAALFYQKGVRVRRDQHAVTRNRTLAAGAFGYPVPIGPPRYGIHASPTAHSGPKPYWVALHATSRAAKLWPPEHWVVLGQGLARLGFATLLPSGTDREAEAARVIAAGIGPSATCLPRMAIRALAGVLAEAAAVVGVDTGLVHLGAALGRPTVGIYCDTDPLRTGVFAEGQAVNVGGIGAHPSPTEVMAALARLEALPCL
ncbi:MAG: lipopolysaccharide heptosyltransferase I [Gammaproteobacteria bacterium]|nr:lipopolysaccharide heptosyltransferase I [Gammaproteobacteria bacterium]